MSYSIRLSREAAAQIRAARGGGRRTDRKLQERFEKRSRRGSSSRVRGLLQASVPHPHHPDVHRLFLSRIRYHLYYRVSQETGSVEVLALWHTSRGSPPKL